MLCREGQEGFWHYNGVRGISLPWRERINSSPQTIAREQAPEPGGLETKGRWGRRCCKLVGESKLASYPLFRFMGTCEKCSMVADRWWVLSTGYCSSPPGRSRAVPHTLVLSSWHSTLPVFMLLRSERLETRQNACPELFFPGWKGLWPCS